MALKSCGTEEKVLSTFLGTEILIEVHNLIKKSIFNPKMNKLDRL
jgi:hypothetical protein